MASPRRPQVQLPTTRPLYPDNIEALLNSNSPPSPEEEYEIKKLRQDAINEADNLKTEIAQIEARLLSMRMQLSDSERRIADYAEVLNPASLPPDVLTEIFNLLTECDIESISNTTTGSLHPKEMHWILPQVSSHWRSVALSSHQLWSTIRIADYELSHPSPLFMLSLQLHRAEKHPLSVSIHSRTIPIQPRHPIVQTLLPLSARWRMLSLYMPLESLTNVLLAVRPFLCSLTSMHLWSRDATSTALSAVPGIYPALQRVSGHPLTLSACSIPRDQITVYNCDQLYYMMPDHLEFLSLLPNLRQCRIYSHYTTAADAHVVLHLYIREKSSSFPLNSILNHLTLPSLKILTLQQIFNVDLQAPTAPPQLGYQPLTTFLNRSMCSLIMLSLISESNRMSGEASLSILTALPSISTLVLGCRLEIGIADLINCIIETPTLVPLLQCLFLRDDVALAMFPAADVSRWREARPGLVLRQLSHGPSGMNTVAV